MGFFSFVKKIFNSGDQDDRALEAARARHGIVLSAKDKMEMDKGTTDEERMAEDYNVWDELKTMRSSFFIGGWASKKFHPVGEDKVKKQLDALAKKREEEAKDKEWEKWGKK